MDSTATSKDILALVVKQLASLGIPYAHNFAGLHQYLVSVLCFST